MGDTKARVALALGSEAMECGLNSAVPKVELAALKIVIKSMPKVISVILNEAVDSGRARVSKRVQVLLFLWLILYILSLPLGLGLG